MGALEIIYQSSVSGRRFKRFQCVTNVHYRLVTDNLEQLNFNFSQRVSNCTDKMSGNPRICPVNTQFCSDTYLQLCGELLEMSIELIPTHLAHSTFKMR